MDWNPFTRDFLPIIAQKIVVFFCIYITSNYLCKKSLSKTTIIEPSNIFTFTESADSIVDLSFSVPLLANVLFIVILLVAVLAPNEFTSTLGTMSSDLSILSKSSSSLPLNCYISCLIISAAFDLDVVLLLSLSLLCFFSPFPCFFLIFTIFDVPLSHY